MSSYKGIVFDFNGTLFWDTHLHNEAWDIFLAHHKKILSDDEKDRKIHGQSNKDILTAIFERPVEGGELFDLANEKEAIYRDLCSRQSPGLAPGAAGLLDYLSSIHFPCCIATASGPENIAFYYEIAELHKWFTPAQIIFNDGTLRGKPAPDLFLRAFDFLGTNPGETIVIEDSVSGIAAAEQAGAGKIIVVQSAGEPREYPMQILKSFNEVNHNLFGAM
ncbi:MAG: HAD family phosphatase [Ignavibacteria bacterium]|nr:HAD family phosphatase [Ignavibacteria bacterium]